MTTHVNTHPTPDTTRHTTRHARAGAPVGGGRARRWPTGRVWASIGAAALASVGLSSPAAADADYHTYHAPLTAIGDEPLGKGFVNNIHTDGPTVYAMEYYHLVHASPNTTYHAVIYLYPFDPDCAGAPLDFGFLGGIPSAEITTNRAGNGHGASQKFTPEDVESLRGAEHGVNWVFFVERQGHVFDAVYESGCSVDYLD